MGTILKFILNYGKKIWDFISGLNDTTKNALIILFGISIFAQYMVYQNRHIVEEYTLYQEELISKSEEYTLKMAPLINQYIKNIANKDTAAADVLLLTYHNSKKTLLGFSYVYLDYFTESIGKLDLRPLKNLWRDLEYVYYVDELEKIRDNEYLQISEVESMRLDFPKLYERMTACDAVSCAFYPIEGTAGGLGLIVVFYKYPKIYNVHYYTETIAPEILKLASILDYTNILNLVNE